MRHTLLAMIVSAMALAGMGGCSSTLETGYEPESFGATDAQRRAYYAPAFSREAAAAGEDRVESARSRRPSR